MGNNTPLAKVLTDFQPKRLKLEGIIAERLESMQIFAVATISSHISATKRRREKSLGTNIDTIPTNMCTDFQIKRCIPKGAIVKKVLNAQIYSHRIFCHCIIFKANL